MDIFERLQSGESVPFDDPQYSEIFGIVSRTMKLLAELNASADSSEVRKILGEITDQTIDASTTLFLPFQINLGKFTRIGKNVFINHDCTFLDMGGITIEDDVLIGPKVCIATEGHPLNPQERKQLQVKPVVIKRNA
jgi:acetyltransferase-like isoleucine patch superfamily enzyme